MDPIPGGSNEENREESLVLKRRTLSEVMFACDSRKFEDRCHYLLEYIMERTKCPEVLSNVIKHKLSYFNSDFKVKLKEAQFKKERFFNQNKKWLDTDVILPMFFIPTGVKSGGRPSVEFLESSDRSKRRKTEEIRLKMTSDELMYAAQMNLRAEGRIDAAVVAKDMQFSTPTRAQKYRTAFKKRDEKVVELSAERALSVLVEAKLTKHQYEVVRSEDKKRFPSYKKIQVAKLRCYPDPEAVTVTETTAEVKLQALLNHTAERIVRVQSDVLQIFTQEELKNLTLICKWGCDGSSGFTQYKQKFTNNKDSDASIFLISFVPLQLISGDPNIHGKKIVWQNPRSGSPRFCRPIKIQLIHETTDLILQTKKYIEDQIRDLKPSPVSLESRIIYISHTLLFTMVDGKVCNAATSTSSTQKCYICGETSKTFNNIDLMLERKVITYTLSFGLSTLHSWIRFFEYLLHMAYKLPIKQWQARGKENKIIVGETKKKIQEDFKIKMGLIVDRPKPGFGSSNDGNTARRFFQDISLSSEITGIDKDIIRRFRVILQTISSGYHINTKSFQEYTLNTARLLVEKYPWYNMPTTVHKILIHSADIIESFLIPIGQLTEESQEALNKDIKKYRDGFARKCSRKQTLEDVFKRLLLCSDPVISSIRKLPKKRFKTFDKEVLNLLLPPELHTPSESEPDSSSDSEDASDSDI